MDLDTIVLDVSNLGMLLLRLGVALVLALPIGWERELSTRSAGLRTFPLVAVASCGFALLAVQVLSPDLDAHSRVLQGLMTGIGFIGGGAILKAHRQVHGTATAAGIWVTGAIGAACGYGRFDMAITLSLLTVAVLRVLGAVERRVTKDVGETTSDES